MLSSTVTSTAKNPSNRPPPSSTSTSTSTSVRTSNAIATIEASVADDAQLQSKDGENLNGNQSNASNDKIVERDAATTTASTATAEELAAVRTAIAIEEKSVEKEEKPKVFPKRISKCLGKLFL